LAIRLGLRGCVNSRGYLSSPSAKQVELRTDGAIREHASNSLKVLQGRQVREDGLVVCVLAGAGKVTRVVQHFPALCTALGL